MNLIVEIPTSYAPERRYVIDVLLREFLGLDFTLRPARQSGVRITDGAADTETHELLVDDGLFATPREDWLNTNSLPKHPVAQLDPSEANQLGLVAAANVPILYGNPVRNGAYFQLEKRRIHLGIDLFGSAFFMLTRYEEMTAPHRDEHGRFPASASVALQDRFLKRPIVNEYVEILWQALKRLWPGLDRRPREHRVLVSHDVDRPFQVAHLSPGALTKELASAAVLQAAPLDAMRRGNAYFATRRGRYERDPFYTFDFLMDVSEKHGLTSAFYFAAGRGHACDSDYDLADERIQALLKTIHNRGHEIGLHPSYLTFRDAELVRQQFGTLRATGNRLGIRQETWGGRQHYLRWENPITWQNWDDAGLDYDSTLAFADQVGFRCGTCYEYPVFNLLSRQQLKLRERPLIAMDVTALAYMHLGWDETVQAIAPLCETCRLYNGDFTLLWHNNSLATDKEKHWYQVLLDEITRR